MPLSQFSSCVSVVDDDDYYYYNAFIMRHTSGLKTCSEALTKIQYRKHKNK